MMIGWTQLCCVMVCLGPGDAPAADEVEVTLAVQLKSGTAEVEFEGLETPGIGNVANVKFTGIASKIDLQRGESGAMTGEILLTGGVKVVGESFVGSADRFRFNFESGKITLTAKPGSVVRISGKRKHSGFEVEARTLQFNVSASKLLLK